MKIKINKRLHLDGASGPGLVYSHEMHLPFPSLQDRGETKDKEKDFMEKVEMYCDGACSGNPGPGGYGCIVRKNGTEKEFSGGLAYTTNNQMEMMAAIVGLESLTVPSRVTLTSDSVYLIKGMTEWIEGWQKKGWVNSSKQPVKNRELWERLLKLDHLHEINWVWVKGHAGHPENERCDILARAGIGSF